MKTAERERARKLRRRDGRSVKEIAAILGVSRSSVSLWVRDIELTLEQEERLHGRVSRGQFIGSKANEEKAHLRRRMYHAQGRRRARIEDAGYVAGCMLYWAEGDKARNSVRLANSDPEVIRFFVRFLRRYFAIEAQKIRLSCNLFADHEHRQREIEDFWLRVAEVDRRSLCKSTVNRYSKYSQKKRKNKLPYGTCRVVVNDTRIVQTIYGSIQEYGGFERPEWLG